MKKKIALLILFSLLFSNLFCQQASIDSLNKIIANPPNDTALVNAWLNLDNLIYLADPQQDEVLNKKILEFSEQKIKTEKGKTLLYFYRSKQLVGLNNLGIITMYRSENEAAKTFFSRAVTLANDLGNKQKIAAAYNNFGVLYYRLGNYSKSIEYYTKALGIMESANDLTAVAGALNNIGNIYKEIGDTTKALSTFRRSLSAGKKVNAKNWTSVSMCSIAQIYSDRGMNDSAEILFKESMRLDLAIGNKQGIASNLANLSKLALLNHNPKDAKIKADSALLLFKEVNDSRAIGLTLSILGLYYEQTGDLTKAISSNKAALDILMPIGQIQEAEKAAAALYHLYKKKSDYKNALEAKELYDNLHDSLQNEKNTKAVIRQEFKYEYERQSAIDELKQQAELDKKDVELKVRKQIQLILIGGLLLIIGFAIFIFNRLKVISKQKVIIEKQKSEVEQKQLEAESQKMVVEEKNREILDSINYAKRIQQALLPTDIYIDKNLKRLNNGNKKKG